MIYLGSERKITQDYKTHGHAEDYAGSHRSIIKINGYGKVINVVNHFKSHEDTINYNLFLQNMNKWKDGSYYNCLSITGKSIRIHKSELGGNCVFIETYKDGLKLLFKLYHLDEVLVKVGDLITPDKIIAKQGSTGMIVSSKDVHDLTYGSHVHFEIRDLEDRSYNPNDYARGLILTTYIDPENGRDETKEQLQILVNKINIRKDASELSLDIGDVYYGEVYNILGTVDSPIYTWYKIKTNNGLNGYIASQKGRNWIKILPVKSKENINLIYSCSKEDYYYLKLKIGEKLYIKKD